MLLKLYKEDNCLLKSDFEQDSTPIIVDSQEAQRLYELDDEYEKQEARLARVVRYQKQQAGNVNKQLLA